MQDDAFSVLRDVYASGATLTALEDERIGVAGAYLSDELQERVRVHREVIHQILQEQRIGQYDAFSWSVPRQYVVPPRCIARDACHRLGTCGPPGTMGSCSALEE